MDYKKLGTNIKKIRRSLNITQEKLAEKIEKSSVFISQIENGARKPSLETVFNIAKILDVPLSVLIGDIPENFIELEFELDNTNINKEKIYPLLKYKNPKELAEAFKAISIVLDKL